MQGSQSTNVLSTKILIGNNQPKFSTAKVLCYMVIRVIISQILFSGRSTPSVHCNLQAHMKYFLSIQHAYVHVQPPLVRFYTIECYKCYLNLTMSRLSLLLHESKAKSRTSVNNNDNLRLSTLWLGRITSYLP